MYPSPSATLHVPGLCQPKPAVVAIGGRGSPREPSVRAKRRPAVLRRRISLPDEAAAGPVGGGVRGPENCPHPVQAPRALAPARALGLVGAAPLPLSPPPRGGSRG